MSEQNWGCLDKMSEVNFSPAETLKSDLSEGSDEFAHFARIQKALPEGSDFDNVFLFFFLVNEGRDDPNTTISGPTSACQRNAI